MQVDNTAPSLAFAASQSPNDPELIRALASDATSGLDGSTATIAYRPRGASAWSELPTDNSGNALERADRFRGTAAGQL